MANLHNSWSCLLLIMRSWSLERHMSEKISSGYDGMICSLQRQQVRGCWGCHLTQRRSGLGRGLVHESLCEERGPTGLPEANHLACWTWVHSLSHSAEKEASGKPVLSTSFFWNFLFSGSFGAAVYVFIFTDMHKFWCRVDRIRKDSYLTYS